MNFELARFRYLTRASPSVPALEDIERAVYRNLATLGLAPEELSGKRIAVAAGSRGIASLKEIVRAACRWLKERDAKPFVFPAMGSHGGATAEGQRRVLETYGITEAYAGVPILSSMETVQVAETAPGVQVCADRNAWEADKILVVNRIKPHTSFSGRIESGLLKMMAVGMGKQKGAEEVHRLARKASYEQVIRDFSAAVLATGKILCGLAVIENELHQVCKVRAMRPGELPSEEETLLKMARGLVPRIPLPKLQLLIVDELGKNISGTGMDCKVIGRGVSLTPGEAPVIDMLYVRDLTPETEGNALGIGYADLAHERVRHKMDFGKTYINARTSLNTSSVRLPMCFPSDRDALQFAISALDSPTAPEQHVAWIRNTLDLNRIAVSEAAAEESAGLKGWQISAESFEPQFDSAGDLAKPAAGNLTRLSA